MGYERMPNRVRNKGKISYRGGTGGIKMDVITTNARSFSKFSNQYKGFYRNDIYDYKAVIMALNQFYVDYAIDTANLVILPNGMGKFGIRKVMKPLKQKPDGTFNLKVNWVETKRTGNLTYFTNDHTGGNSFKFVWLKKSSRLPYPECYKGKVVPKARRRLRDVLVQEDYNWDKYHYMTDATRERLIERRIKREQNAAREQQ